MKKFNGCSIFIIVAIFVLLFVPASMLFPAAPPDGKPEPVAVQKYHIYKFSGKFCPACRLQQASWLMTSANESLKKQGIKVFDLDIEKAKTLGDAWKVKVIPTTIIVEVGSTGVDAKPIRRHDGRLSESQIETFVDLSKAWPPAK